MRIFKRLIAVICCSLCFISPVFAASSFIVKHIDVVGLQRVRSSTVMHYLPIHVGERFRPSQSGRIINALYQTGFFDNIRLARRGNVLIIVVQERPTIAYISVSGNKTIKTKKLKPILTKFGITEGETFDSAKLNEIVQGLKQEYDRIGHYAAKVTAKIKHEPRNRVAIYLHIYEGPIAKVHKIEIIGNHAFSRHELLKQFQLTTPGIFTWFSHRDRYSKVQLEEDLQHLRFFYLDHGYLDFQIVSKKVTITPDHKSVDIVIYIREGAVYRISGYSVTGRGAKNSHVLSLITLQKGQIFSRQQVIDINKNIGNYYANCGFAFPQISVPNPRINKRNHTVFITFLVKPGRRIYVRQIHFFGNDRTMDKVFRARMRQMEASVFSLKKIKESKRKLALLPYLRHVTVQTVPVVGHPDLVDLNFHSQEVNAGRASIQGGYGTDEGFLYGASISEPNFMGTGKYVAIGFQNSGIQDNYYLSYTNPMFTLNGVSLGFSLNYTHQHPNKTYNIDNSYNLDDYGGSFTFGIPLAENLNASFGFGYDHIRISDVNTAIASPNVLQFLAQHPSPYNQANLSGAISLDTRDQAVFPTSGGLQTLGVYLGAPVSKTSVGYFKVTFDGEWYIPLGHGFIISPHTSLGYGDGLGNTHQLPFFENFYAGGISTLPGFESNSLGPKNPQPGSGNNAIGGNVELLAGVNFIIPNPFTDKIRVAAIVDAGNIFETNRITSNPQIKYESVSLKNFRAAAGILVSWYSPLGLINVSVAKAFVTKSGDQTTPIGFSFGTAI